MSSHNIFAQYKLKEDLNNIDSISQNHLEIMHDSPSSKNFISTAKKLPKSNSVKYWFKTLDNSPNLLESDSYNNFIQNWKSKYTSKYSTMSSSKKLSQCQSISSTSKAETSNSNTINKANVQNYIAYVISKKSKNLNEIKKKYYEINKKQSQNNALNLNPHQYSFFLHERDSGIINVKKGNCNDTISSIEKNSEFILDLETGK